MRHVLVSTMDREFPILRRRATCSCGWEGGRWNFDTCWPALAFAAKRAAKREWQAHVEGSA